MQLKISIIITLLLYINVKGQTIVSTTVENKKTVIEYFSGNTNDYSPDADNRIANMVNSNPDNIIPINIPSGPFAIPANNSPDLRCDDGILINSQVDLAGYPAGQINRRVFPDYAQNPQSTAVSRGFYNTCSNIILSEISPVNIALTAEFDSNTRDITIYCEAYYTSDINNSNKLHVALVQNNIEGYQAGSIEYNPGAVLPNGNYNNVNVLRDMITPTQGIDINFTSEGSLYANTIIYNLPTNINNIDLKLNDLKIIAFISDESYKNVYTGEKIDITFSSPDGATPVFASLSENISTSYLLCQDNITPEVVLRNEGTTVIDSIDVSASYNEITYTKLVNNIAPNTSQLITFDDFFTIASEEDLNITFNANLENYNTQFMPDGEVNLLTKPYYSLSEQNFTFEYTEDFENYANNGTLIDNGIVFNHSNLPIGTRNVTGSGGYTNSNGSFYWNFFNIQSTNPSSIIFDYFDFISLQSAELTFDYSYAQYQNEFDKLDILVSTDCGQTWSVVWSRSGFNLATTSSRTNSFFPQSPTEWNTANIDLSAYVGSNNVLIAFQGISDYGNNLFIDNVSVKDVTTLADTQFNIDNNLTVFPNPTREKVSVKFNKEIDKVTVYNSLGQIILTESNTKNPIIQLNKFTSGLYLIEINVDNITTIKKVVKL